MAQSLKDNVRARILDAALEEFAASGCRDATLQAVARRAGVSVGNIYRYYPSREALLAAVLPDPTVAAIRADLLAKFRALAGLDLDAPEARAIETEWLPRLAASLLGWRRELLILFGGPEGSAHAGFAGELAGELADAYGGWRRSRGRELVPPERDFLIRVYRALSGGIAELLFSGTGPETQASIAMYLAYHMAGIRELEHRWVPRDGKTR